MKSDVLELLLLSVVWVYIRVGEGLRMEYVAAADERLARVEI